MFGVSGSGDKTSEGRGVGGGETDSRCDWCAGEFTCRGVPNYLFSKECASETQEHTTLVNLAVISFIGLVESSKSGVGADLMLFSIGLVVPVSCPRDLLWLRPVSHAVFLTVTQRHRTRKLQQAEVSAMEVCDVKFKLPGPELQVELVRNKYK